MTNDLMEMMRNMEKMILKMPFYYELMSVWKAMLLAYGLMEQEEISGGAPHQKPMGVKTRNGLSGWPKRSGNTGMRSGVIMKTVKKRGENNKEKRRKTRNS